MRRHALAVITTILLIVLPIYAPSWAAPLSSAKPWVFSAPPQGSRASQRALYNPIAKYLTHVTDHQVIYRDPGNWLTYSQDMTEGKYDLVFDGPHFTSWRDRYLGDTPLVRVPKRLTFVVMTWHAKKFTRIVQLAGQPVCVLPSPYLGTLALLSQFPDVTRQPYLVTIHSFSAAYHGLMTGHCEAAVTLINNVQRYETGHHIIHILYRTPAYPNQALSAGPRIPPAIQARIQTALLSPTGERVTRPLWHFFGQFIPANRQEYVGLAHLLNNALYFSR